MIGHGLPQRLAEPPLGLMTCRRKLIARARFYETVIDDAVRSRVETRDDGVMIGERVSGENGDQTRFCFGPLVDQAVDVGRWGLELVPETKPVRRNQDNNRSVQFLLDRTVSSRFDIRVAQCCCRNSIAGDEQKGDDEEGSCGLIRLI